MKKYILQTWGRIACVFATLSCFLLAQHIITLNEKIFFLKDGTAIHDVDTPSKRKEIRIQSAPGLASKILADEFGEDIRDVQLGDLDNDGEEELVVLGRTKLVVYELNGDHYQSAPEKALQIYDRGIYDQNPLISFEEVYAAYEGRLVREEGYSGGRLAIGDVDNDGENEIIVTRNSAYTNRGFPFGEYNSVAEILKWGDNRYTLLDVYTKNAARDGVYIIDLDGDGESEIIIGRGSDYGIFGHVEHPEEYPTDRTSIYGQMGFHTGRYQPKGVLSLLENTDEIIQVSRVVIQDGIPVIFRVALSAIAGDTRSLGTIRSYVLDPERIPHLTSERLRQGIPAVPNFSGEDLEQKYRPVQVPTIGEMLQRRAEVDRLSIGDYDGDGNLDVVANMPGRALVYRLEENR